MGKPKTEAVESDAERQVTVRLTGFWMAKYEVTQAQWHWLMGTTQKEQCEKEPDNNMSPEGSVVVEGANHPVSCVSHGEATEFCRKLTQRESDAGRLPKSWEYRLPTEAQWEYACRAGTLTATAFGDSLSSHQANFDGEVPYNEAEPGPNLERTVEVGRYQSNSWGLHDMHGNVGEWVRDWYRDELPGGNDPEATDPEKGRSPRRSVRGGSWYSCGDICRSATRDFGVPTHRRNYVGFRVALVKAPPSSKE